MQLPKTCRQVFEANSGIDLDFFFDQWVYDEYYPFYHYNYLQQSDNTVYFVIKQIQEIWNQRPVFEMPVPLRFSFASGGDTTIVVWNDTTLQHYTFELQAEITSVAFDPDRWILRKAEYNPGIPVQIADFYKNNLVKVYPNPCGGQFYMTFSNEKIFNCELLIYDTNGNLFTKELINDVPGSMISVKGIKSGVWYYILKNEEKVFSSGKIICIN